MLTVEIAKYMTGDFNGSIGDLDIGISGTSSGDSSAYSWRGKAKVETEHFPEAIADFDAAIKLKPGDYHSYVDRGIAERELGKLEDAVRDYDRAISLNPKSGDGLWNRGYTKDLQGDFIGATVDYSNAVALLPKADFLRFRLALVLRRQHIDDDRARLILALPTIENSWAKAVAVYLTGGLSDSAFFGRQQTRKKPRARTITKHRPFIT